MSQVPARDLKKTSKNPKQPIKITLLLTEDTEERAVRRLSVVLKKLLVNGSVFVSTKNQTEVSRLLELLKGEKNMTAFRTVIKWYPNLVFTQLI